MKIAFIHNNAKTGASVHAYMLALHLQKTMDVTFLSGTLVDEGMDFSTLKKVHEFPYSPGQRQLLTSKWPLLTSLTVRLRMLLFHLGLLRFADNSAWIWTPFRSAERKWISRSLALPQSLTEYIERHDSEYDAYIVLGTFSGPAFYLSQKHAHKTILIPLVHMEMPQFMLSVHDITRRFHAFAYNTVAEKELCERIHGDTPQAEVIGAGISAPVTDDNSWQKLAAEHTLANGYLLYVGRLTPRKTGKLFEYFSRYQKKHHAPTKLVIIGDNYLNTAPRQNDILYLGFVDENVKCELIRHATAVLNPSTVESLSLIVLEAMHAGVPVLVNGKCDVLRNHCEQSDGGLYYTDYSSFECALSLLLQEPSRRIELGHNGQQYERLHYSWPTIVQKWTKFLNHVCEAN